MGAQWVIDGGAAYYNSGSDGYSDPLEFGNLTLLDGPLVCIECSIDVWLNLIGLHYAASGASSVNPADGRGLLLSHHSFYDYYTNTTHAFHAQAVPLPAATWLFVSGPAAFGLIDRNKV